MAPEPPAVTPALAAQFQAKYQAFKAALGLQLGGGAIGTTADFRGLWLRCANGAVVYRPDLGLWELHGPLYDRWVRLGASAWGYPKADQQVVAGGAGMWSHLLETSSGMDVAVAWYQKLAAYLIPGVMFDKWAALGGPAFGYPTSDEVATPGGGGYINFDRILANGQPEPRGIWRTAEYGAHAIKGAVYNAWNTKGGLRASIGTTPLGPPRSDEFPTPDNTASVVQHFAAGSIVFTNSVADPNAERISYPNGWTAWFLNAGDKFGWTQRNDGYPMGEHLKMYKDDAVIYGFVREVPHVNFPGGSERSYANFIQAPWYTGSDDPPDGDLNVHIVLDHVDEDFWNVGFAWGSPGDINKPADVEVKLEPNDYRVAGEAIMYGRTAKKDLEGLQAPLIPGWAEAAPTAVTVDGEPLGSLLEIGSEIPGEGGNPIGWEVAITGRPLEIGTPVRLTGFLTLDCHWDDVSRDCGEGNKWSSNVEIHPIYDISIGTNPHIALTRSLLKLRQELWTLIDAYNDAYRRQAGFPVNLAIAEANLVRWRAANAPRVQQLETEIATAEKKKPVRWPGPRPDNTAPIPSPSP